MSKGNALRSAKARIVTLEGQLDGANATIIAQRTALAGLKRDAITNADAIESRLKALTNVIDEYNRDLAQAENELSQVQSELVALTEKHEAYCKMVCQVSIITLSTLFLSITMWSVL